VLRQELELKVLIYPEDEKVKIPRRHRRLVDIYIV
jgi:hypothetical protein